jgi:hypothetical protein
MPTKQQPQSGNNDKTQQDHWVEFKTLKDLFSFVITKSIPGQQFLSVIRFREITYAFTPLGEAVMVFFTKEEPKSPVYAWDSDADKFLPVPTPDRTRLNILVQQVEQDTLISSLFYSGK